MTKKMTTKEGQPWRNNQNSQTAGKRGPILIQDYQLLERLAHFNRERIPERVVHAKGASAKGYFKVTKDMSDFTKAAIFRGIGKKTPATIRFSQVAGEAGYPDTYRDVRGFAVKFYTEEGNYDIVGNNTPVFFVNDPLKFPDFIHSQKRDPRTHKRSPDMQWDFWSLSPETIHQLTILMSDRGIPASYRNMHGFGSHTFKWVNEKNEPFWVKYHFKTNQGIQNLSNELANKLAGLDTDYLQNDLYDAIENEDFPSWTVSVQLLPYQEGLDYKYDIFDVTKVISQKDYPLIEIGQLVLNANPTNNFEEVEELAFSPANLVPGIEVSPDRLLQGRLFAYKDAARYRLGVNYETLPVNKPHVEVNSYSRDGYMSSHQSTEVNYEPNSFDGPTQVNEAQTHGEQLEGEVGSYPMNDDYFSAAARLYKLMTEAEKEHLIETIRINLSQVTRDDIKIRQLNLFYKVDEDYGKRVADALGLDPFEKEN